MNKRFLPGPKDYLALKKSFVANSLSAFDRYWKEYGDLFRAKMAPGITWYVALHPDMAERVLSGHGKRYQRPKAMHKPLALLFGEGVLTSEGDKWRRQRRMMQPAFHRQSLADIAEIMTRSARGLVAKWQSLPEGSVIDLLSELQEVTLNVVGESLLGSDLDEKTDQIKQSFLHCAHFVARRTGRPINLPVWIPAPKNRRFISNRDTLDQIALEIIRSRRAHSNGRRDLLAMLIEARDADTGDGMTDQEIRDEVVTILFAGHESVSLTLLWTFYLLSQHADILQNLVNELDRTLNGNAPGPEDFMRLPYTRMVIEETLRLYPPAWFQPRQPITEDEIAGYSIPKKAYVIVSAYFTHRHPEFWNDPETFDPMRFTESKVAKRHKFAYFPFGGGPRICIGNQFAMMEATLILATVLQRFRPEQATEKPVEALGGHLLRPKEKLQMKLIHRRSARRLETNAAVI